MLWSHFSHDFTATNFESVGCLTATFVAQFETLNVLAVFLTPNTQLELGG
jgi:hypothetical protein